MQPHLAKNWKKLTAEEKFDNFLIKLGPQTRTSSNSKNEMYDLFSIFMWHFFALLDPDPDCESGSECREGNPLNPDPIRIRNTGNFRCFIVGKPVVSLLF